MSIRYISFFAGANFPDESYERAKDLDLDFIGADAGSIDTGPYQLAGAGTLFSGDLCRYDLKRALLLARAKKIPLLVGSCGGSGRDAGVDWFAEMIRDIAKAEGLAPFKMALIYSEFDRDYLSAKLREEKFIPLSGLQMPYTEEHIRRSTRIVGVMGAEPFIAAYEAGAEVILAGRATDPAIFAAIPLARHTPHAIAWHAAKIAECGGAIGEPSRNDLLHVVLEQDSFLVTPMAENARCTPWSVSAHQLYENSDPTQSIEPSGLIDTKDAVYAVEDARTVRISGSRFTPAAQYSIKLEGIEPAGYQTISMGAYNDPVLLEELPEWLPKVRSEIDKKLSRVFGARAKEAMLTIRTYGGGNGSDLFRLSPIEVPKTDAFFLIDAVAPTQDMATSVATVAWHTLIHFPPSGWKGSFVTAAWPFNPPVIDRGLIHRFNVNHAVKVDNPLEVVRFAYEVVG